MLADFEWPSPPRGMVWGRKPYLEYSKTVLVRPLYQSGQDGSQAIPCATLNVTMVMGEYRLYIESLKYYDKERGCLVSGRKILKWAISSFDDKVFVIDLTDESTAVVASAVVELTRFRKMCKGKGWYETFGFRPVSDEEDQKYQLSFETMRNAPADLVLALVLVFYFVLTKKGIGADSNACMADILKASSYAPERRIRVPVETRRRILGMEANMDDAEKKRLRGRLKHFLTFHGVCRDMFVPMQTYLTKPVREKVTSGGGRRFRMLVPPFYEKSPFPVREPSRKTFANLAAPRGIQTLITKAIDAGDYDAGTDLAEYVSSLETVLEALEAVHFLYVPERLVRMTG